MSVQSGAQAALIIGVGEGLGWSLVRRFASSGFQVAMAARSEEKLERLLAREPQGNVRAYSCDVADRSSVEALFERVTGEIGSPDVVIFNAGAFVPGSILEIDPEDFERCWRVGCLGGFRVGQLAARAMVQKESGTILFTGATASLRGNALFANLAVPKFGLRALAQSMARELGPRGIHVGHIIIDGQIDSQRYRDTAAGRQPGALLNPDAIAEAYYQLHIQDPSAWTFELDLRPWIERF